MNNKACNLPPVFFKIRLKNLHHQQINYSNDNQVYLNMLEGGRLIELLPLTVGAERVNTTMPAFDTDIVNLIIGPLSEAKHVLEMDNEPFNSRLINLQALPNYGGSSKLALVNDYLKCFSVCQQERNEKLDTLFTTSFNFVNERANWMAINKLANYIIDSDKSSVCYEDVASLLEN